MKRKDLRFLTYHDAEELHRQGAMSDAEWVWYRYHWRNGAARYSHVAEQFEDFRYAGFSLEDPPEPFLSK